MIQITINGNPVPTRDGATIFEAAYENKYARTQFDTDIMSLHYLKGVQEKRTADFALLRFLEKELLTHVRRSLSHSWKY